MGNLQLEFSTSPGGKTYLKNQYAAYPFHICKAQYFENDPPGMANIYIQSASGGIYEDEALSTNVIAHSSSYSQVTTQASTIVHGMPHGMAHHSVDINVTSHSYTEYISDPLILFPESKLCSRINVFIDDTSTAVVADSFLLHFLSGDGRMFELLNSSLQINTEDAGLLTKDVYRVNSKNFLGNNRSYIGMGTIYVINRADKHQHLLESLQSGMQVNKDFYGGVSYLPNHCGLLVKFLVKDGDVLKKTIQDSWIAIRQYIVGVKPNIRRK